MASPSIIEVESLLKPISEDQPQGSDIREDSSPTSVYYQIKDARNTARAAERASMFDPDKAADVMDAWRPILDLAPTVLKDHAKDLEVASWFTEALIRYHGFAGLRDGFALAKGLVDQYWENLYPEPDEDGIETKVAPLAGLNGDSGEGTLLAPIRNVDITSSASHGYFSYWQYQQARDAARLTDPDKRKEKEESLGYSLDKVEAAVADSSAQFFTDMVDDLEQAINDFKDMNNALREYCKHDAPPFSLILETLEEVLRSVRFVAKDKLIVVEEPMEQPTASTPEAAGSAAPTVAVSASSGAIASREDALRRLEEVAKYFKATEPHTPLVTGIERLVRWGRMPMAELIQELVPDPTARAFYQHLTGASFSEESEAADTSAYQATANVGVAEQASSSNSSQDDSGSSQEMSW